MQVRVVTDQPWDVAADVLVVPIVGEVAFDGPLDELDRRTGGELRALAAFGELRAKRYATALAAPGEIPVGRVVVVAAGDADGLDRETVVADRGDGGAAARPAHREPSGVLADARSPTVSATASRSRPSSSRAGSSRARTTRRRSTATPWSRRRRTSTSSS